jgi:hypothetical protein
MPRSVSAWFVCAVTIACSWPAAVAARGSAPDLVSYLVCADCDTNAFIPEDREYRFHVPDLVWQWRLFDPARGRDTLLFDVPSFPLMVEWDSSFTYVEFISGNRLMRVPWRMGALPREMAQWPADSAFLDYWSDAGGRYHLVVLDQAPRHPSEIHTP